MNSLPIPDFPIQFLYHFEDCQSPVSRMASKKSSLDIQAIPEIELSSLEKFQLESEPEDIMNA